MDETSDQSPGAAGPAAAQPGRAPMPTTPEEHERSLRIIRFAIAFSVGAIALMTWIFIAFLDAPVVPLLPLAILVIAIDFVMLGIFTRQRQRAIDAIRERDGGVPSGD